MQLQELERKRSTDNPVNWVTAFFMAAFHVGAIAALFFFTWKALFVAIFLWWISGSLGIGMGYHRLLTHRGYRTPKWVEYFLTVCATLTLEGGPIFWVATHRIHHQFADHHRIGAAIYEAGDQKIFVLNLQCGNGARGRDCRPGHRARPCRRPGPAAQRRWTSCRPGRTRPGHRHPWRWLTTRRACPTSTAGFSRKRRSSPRACRA